MQTTILSIAFDVPLDKLFDYLDIGTAVSVGQRVLVSLGNRQTIGVVVKVGMHSDVPINKLKSIIHAFTDEIALTEEVFRLVRFCADYYQTPFGQALLTILPARLRQISPAATRKQKLYRLSLLAHAQGIDALPVKKKVMRKVVEALLEHEVLHEKAMAEIASTWRNAVRELQVKDWLQVQYVDVVPLVAKIPHMPAPILNIEQQNAINAVLAERDKFKPWLLYGVTGSGKTEVYMRLMEAVLQQKNTQVLVMVPEINLTPQLEARFRGRFPQITLVSLHSHLGEGDRLANWQAAQSGRARIVIGTRLSIFTPMPALKLLIVDEEHDSSYKQQEGMRYSARDVALLRAKQLNIPIVLGSATPALETWHNASQGENQKFGLLKLQQRAVSEARLPKVYCVDTSKTPLQHGLSPQLIAALRQRLENGEQSLLFLNRRGYAPVLFCNTCLWVAPCKRCSARLVVHLKQRKLRCHHCGHEQNIPLQCPSCGNPDLHPTGQGTQRLEETLHQLLPEARILRVDRDSTQRKDALFSMLSAVHASEVDILLGTQMLAKGHDFPNLTLVGVLDTDSALFSPDFRATERLFAQLMQVSGRAGRGEKTGEVLIQTAFPQHTLFDALRRHDYMAYADTMLHERIQMGFPPYSYAALLRVEANDYVLVENFLREALQRARAISSHVMMYDIVRPQMERRKGMERAQLMLQAHQRGALQKLLQTWIPQVREIKLANRVRWVVDVDPLEF